MSKFLTNILKDVTNTVNTETVVKPREEVKPEVQSASMIDTQEQKVEVANKPVVRTQDGIYQCGETDIFNLINIS